MGKTKKLGYKEHVLGQTRDCTEVRFVSFLSGGFITMAVKNPSESKLAKRTAVDWNEELQTTRELSRHFFPRKLTVFSILLA